MLLNILGSLRTLASASVTICVLTFSDPHVSHASGPGYYLESYDTTKSSPSDKQSSRNASLKACSTTSNCVSSNYLEPPNRYVSPLKIVNVREVAFKRAMRDIKASGRSDISVADAVPEDFYIHLTVPGTAPYSLDDIEILFTPSGDIVNVRCEARVTLPTPPFCIQKNCINGSMDQRRRVADISYILGLPPSDQEQMQGAKWTPIFFNSDKVPGFYDD